MRREKAAAETLQTLWRTYLAAKKEEKAAKTLQNVWYAHATRRCLLQILSQLELEEYAAILFQCKWRQYTSKSTLAQLQQERREQVAAVLLQCKWRQHSAQSTLAQLRQERREQVAAVLLQCMWRQHTAQLRQERREQVAAVLLQCKWRQHTSHSTLARLQQDRIEEIAAVLLQSKWRQRTAQSTLAQLRQEQKDREFAVLLLQCAYRCYNARVKMVHIRRNHKEMSDAAVLIQSMIRKQMAKKYAHELKSKRDVLSRQRAAALSIQCWWRCCLVQRQMRIRQVECSHHEAALTLQCALRRYAAYQQAVQRRNGTVKIQSWYRGSKSRAKTRRYLEESRRIRQEVSRVEAATKIQRFYREQQRPLSNLAEDDSKEFNHISYGDALTELPSLLSEMNATSGHTRVASYAPTEVLAPSQCYIQTGAPTEVAPTARGTPSIQDNTSGDLFLGQDRNTLKSLHAVLSDQEEASQLENASVCSGTFSSTTWNSAEEEKSSGKATPFTQNTWSSRVSNLSLAESFAPLMAKGGNLAGFMAPAAADVSRLYSEEVAPIRKALAQERERTVELQRKVLFLEAALASQTAQGPNTAYSASTHQNLALELRRASAELARMNSGPDNGRPQSTAEENKGH
uniref:Uncharacterized protein n=1 Tax=Heterosigma akashiwo TaxID=2829 RepID=A0A7S4DBY0_HETAK